MASSCVAFVAGNVCCCETSRLVSFLLFFSSQVKQDNPEAETAVYRDSCISELPTQATFDVATKTVIQVADQNLRERENDDGGTEEPPMKRAYREGRTVPSGISKLVEFCSKDIK